MLYDFFEANLALARQVVDNKMFNQSVIQDKIKSLANQLVTQNCL